MLIRSCVNLGNTLYSRRGGQFESSLISVLHCSFSDLVVETWDVFCLCEEMNYGWSDYTDVPRTFIYQYELMLFPYVQMKSGLLKQMFRFVGQGRLPP